ncbi:nucleotidyltransferase [Defluviitalea phaphyphila]|uniref:nucleotidyltransferase n=1 Tax=Defluviitalea phaphyphila TaxID=1473580 RepID=UPI00073071BC|nr:nucleotidyltransferase [Defluviitalea phaphyphila]
MKTVGIITEYNPFHNGHLYHLKKSKEITQSNFCVVVMSGNFVQRGEPAIIDKWTRTLMALKAGADLVIELPVIYSISSAEFFSFGAISLLHKSGIIDSICFGSEHGNLKLLSQIANFLYNEPEDFKINIKKYLSKGLTFPKARNKALLDSLRQNNIFESENELNEILSSPNNILGIEYLKALKALNSSIVPFTIKRKGEHYHSSNIESSIASATGIRKAIKNNKYDILFKTIPKDCAELLLETINKGLAPVYLNDFSLELNYVLRTISKKELKGFMGITEGLENRIFDLSANNFFIDDLVKKIKTKRYTLTSIQRSLLNIILQIKSEDFWEFHKNGGPQYIRILGFRKSASFLLKKLKQNACIPIISNFKDSYQRSQGLIKKMLEKEVISTNIYSLHYPNSLYRIIGKEFSSPVIILDR